jgi:general secretion pathway protein A
VLIVDEAQTLKPTLLEFLRQLLNYETNEQKLLQVVLFGQNELRPKLRRKQNLYNRLHFKAGLETLSLADTEEMLKFRWTVAGGKQFPFSSSALEAIYEYSAGVPRTQVILADNTLLAAALDQHETIDHDLVIQVAKDQELETTSKK